MKWKYLRKISFQGFGTKSPDFTQYGAPGSMASPIIEK